MGKKIIMRICTLFIGIALLFSVTGCSAIQGMSEELIDDLVSGKMEKEPEAVA